MVRTTVTLDADTERLVRARMAERQVSFKQALNDAIRESARGDTERFETTVRAMGIPTVDLDRSLRLVGDLEDEERLRRMRSGG